MRGGRCKRRKMMGRGAEGGCGTEERPCPVSRASTPAIASALPAASGELTEEDSFGGAVAGVDFYAQARKALAERSPFDSEESLARVTTLPVALATSLAKHSHGYKKHKKPHAEKGKKAAAGAPSPAPKNVWVELEEYFRPITLEDIDRLVPNLPSLQDKSFLIPALPSAPEVVANDTVTDAVTDTAEVGRLCSTPEIAVAGQSEPILEEVVAVAAEEGGSAMGSAAEAVEQGTDQEPKVAVDDGEEQLLEDMDIDDDDDDVALDNCCKDTNIGCSGDTAASLNWLLGSKHRALLTSERPNKKRKLLGSDAGLQRVLKLPLLQEDDSPLCDYCCSRGNSSSLNQFLCCDSCKASVHQKCYGVHEVPVGAWLCSWCKAGKPLHGDGDCPCLLCPKNRGALKPLGGDECRDEDKFAHLFCSLWNPELYVNDTEAMEPVMNAEGVQETRKKLVCHVCKVKRGACVRCSHGTCRTSFHPICAREAKQRMEIWGKIGCDNVELRVFCSKHSVLQESDPPQLSGDRSTFGGDGTPVDYSLTVNPSTNNKTMNARFTRKGKDNTFLQQKSTDFNAKEDIGASTTLVQSLPATGQHIELQNEDIEKTDIENGSSVHRDSLAFSRSFSILKKLYGGGKIKVPDVASAMGISNESFEAAIKGNPNSLSPHLRTKILRWVQSFARMLASKRTGTHVCSSGEVATADDHTVAVKNKSRSSIVVNGESAYVTVTDDTVLQAASPQTGTSSNTGVTSDNKVHYSPATVGFQPQGSGGLIHKDSENRSIIGADTTDFVNAECSFSDTNCNELEKRDPDAILDGVSCTSEPSSAKKIPTEPGGINVATLSPEHQVVGLPSATSDNEIPEQPPILYLHPLIEQNIMRVIDVWVPQKKDNHGNHVLSVKAAASKGSSGRQSLSLTSVLFKSRSGGAKHEDMSKTKGVLLESLSKVREMGILELSPQDDVEGEILHLQNMLLNNTILVKQQYESVMYKVVSCISKELDALKKQHWDVLLVNRYIREVREAKKRGRKERRHREAQALLAAVSADKASSRVLSLKKDAHDVTSPLESHLTVDPTGHNAGSFSLQQAEGKPPKLAISKMSSGKNTDDISSSCDICKRTEMLLNPIFICGGCKVSVHLGCYRRGKDSISSWYCEPCDELRSQSRSSGSSWDHKDNLGNMPECGLCGGSGGSFRKTSNGQWVHSFCAEWLLESTFRRGQEHPVEGMAAVLKAKGLLSCCICHEKTGLCIKCCYGNCQTAFHPICARTSGLYMNTKDIGGSQQHKVYCEKHSEEQRTKDAQIQGAEELSRIRQIRVELEKLRLLCERTIKREKLKRDLVICSHGILGAKREYVALSMLTHNPFFPVGVSSESATTSINNTSYSGTVERSDDITVDSTVSRKLKLAIPPHVNFERRLGNKPRSHPQFTRKAADNGSFGGKQLPQRAGSMGSHNIVDDEQRPNKIKKPQSLKEVVMTSDQASMQNLRLPKGFAYVPLDSLPKTDDSGFQEQHQPNG